MSAKWIMRRILPAFLVVAALPSLTDAQTATGTTRITQVFNGWYGEAFGIVVANGVSACSNGPNEYAVSSTNPAYREIVAMILTAYTTDAPVIIRTDGSCVASRANILELRLIK